MATTITKTPPTHMQTLDFSFSFTSLQEPLSLCALVVRETVHVLKMTITSKNLLWNIALVLHFFGRRNIFNQRKFFKRELSKFIKESNYRQKKNWFVHLLCNGGVNQLALRTDLWLFLWTAGIKKITSGNLRVLALRYTKSSCWWLRGRLTVDQPALVSLWYTFTI